MAGDRKLAAILAADVAGFSRLAGSDEDRTLARLRALRGDLIDPTIAVHNGRIVKRTGDGAPERAVEEATLAMRLSPQDAQTSAMQAVVALGHFLAGRDDEAYKLAAAAMRELPRFPLAASVAAASAALSGRDAEAALAISHLRERAPYLKVSTLSEWFALRRPEDTARWSEGLRRAGLPD